MKSGLSLRDGSNPYHQSSIKSFAKLPSIWCYHASRGWLWATFLKTIGLKATLGLGGKNGSSAVILSSQIRCIQSWIHLKPIIAVPLDWELEKKSTKCSLFRCHPGKWQMVSNWEGVQMACSKRQKQKAPINWAGCNVTSPYSTLKIRFSIWAGWACENTKWFVSVARCLQALSLLDQLVFQGLRQTLIDEDAQEWPNGLESKKLMFLCLLLMAFQLGLWPGMAL